jgi:hypothetical protein
LVCFSDGLIHHRPTIIFSNSKFKLILQNL